MVACLSLRFASITNRPPFSPPKPTPAGRVLRALVRPLPGESGDRGGVMMSGERGREDRRLFSREMRGVPGCPFSARNAITQGSAAWLASRRDGRTTGGRRLDRARARNDDGRRTAKPHEDKGAVSAAPCGAAAAAAALSKRLSPPPPKNLSLSLLYKRTTKPNKNKQPENSASSPSGPRPPPPSKRPRPTAAPRAWCWEKWTRPSSRTWPRSWA